MSTQNWPSEKATGRGGTKTRAGQTLRTDWFGGIIGVLAVAFICLLVLGGVWFVIADTVIPAFDKVSDVLVHASRNS